MSPAASGLPGWKTRRGGGPEGSPPLQRIGMWVRPRGRYATPAVSCILGAEREMAGLQNRTPIS